MKSLHRLLTGRLIKLTGNLLKVACYPFHWVFPNQRFTLPAISPPLIKPRDDSAIPHILWQTNFTDKVTLPVYLNYLCNRLMAPSFEYRFMITEDREKYIRQYYSNEILNSYSRLQIGAAQADFWRVLVLLEHGGVYLDIDAHLTWPLGRTIGKECAALYLRTKRGDLSNYFIASRPFNPQLKEIAQVIRGNIEENSIKGVFDMTGPGVFNRVLDVKEVESVLYHYACIQGSFTNEYFQYIDKPQGKWTKEQNVTDLVSK